MCPTGFDFCLELAGMRGMRIRPPTFCRDAAKHVLVDCKRKTQIRRITYLQEYYKGIQFSQKFTSIILEENEILIYIRVEKWQILLQRILARSGSTKILKYQIIVTP